MLSTLPIWSRALPLVLVATTAYAHNSVVDEIVTIAHRSPTPINQVGNTVYVLSGQTLREQGFTMVADALASRIPEISLSQTGGMGSSTQIRVRGNEANHVMIMLDGVKLSDPAAGEFNLADLQLAGVANIEILMGPQTLLYGSDAIAGVINIKTNANDQPSQGSLSIASGSNNTQHATGSWALNHGNLSAAIMLGATRSDNISAADEAAGNTESDPYDATQGIAKLGYKGNNWRLGFTHQATDSTIDFDADDYSTGLPIDESPSRNRSYTNNYLNALSFDYSLSDKVNAQITASNTDYKLKSVSDFGFGPSAYNSHGERQTLTASANYRLSQNYTIDTGIESNDETLVTDYFAEQVLESNAAYLQLRADKGATHLSAGMRYDDHDSFGSETTYRATAAHQLSQVTLIANAATAFKAPTAQDLYGWGGNTNLQPETVTSYEIGADIYTNMGDISARAFWQDTDHLIRSVFNGTMSQLQNIDSATADGVSMKVSQTFVSFDHSVSMQWIDATEQQSGLSSKRIRVPKHSASYHIESQPLHGGRVTYWADVQYEGARVDSNWATGGTVKLDSYWLANLGARVILAPTLSMTLRFDNIFDEHYQRVAGYGTPGATTMISLQATF